jgi:hypothetical protein
MNLAIHPTLATPSVLMIVCDNFLMNADGLLDSRHSFLRKMFEL